MKPDHPAHAAPEDAAARKAIRPVICYPVEGLPRPDLAPYLAARAGWTRVAEVLVDHKEGTNEVTVRVNGDSKTFSVDGLDNLWEMSFKLRDIFQYVQGSTFA